jgi:simple sugar transport system permease protein
MSGETLFLIDFLRTSIRMATPLLIASLGGVIAQRSGVVSIGVEGVMLIGASVGFSTAFFTGSLYLGILAALFVGLGMGMLTGLLVITLRADQIVVGLTIVIFGTGLSSFVHRVQFRASEVVSTIVGFPRVAIPVLSGIPVVGPILFDQPFLVYLGILLVPVLWVILFRTTYGLKITATGASAKVADATGINVSRVRYVCLILCCGLEGLAGGFLSLADVGLFFDNMVAGRGWIAMAIVIFGKWNPLGALAGSLLFGGTVALQMVFQTTNSFPYELLMMLPYICTVLVLLFFVRRGEAPAALGEPFKRGE